VYWGKHIGDDEGIVAALERWGEFLSFTREDEIAAKAAALLANGAVIGWVQGRSEFGPRALGNRSIIADPRPFDNKRRINQMVKKREEYRPFAPSVLAERIGEYFEVPESQGEFPFMIFVLKVREHARKLLGAVTHVDGTARVQSVSEATNYRYWRVIKEFEALTNIPILLNTSLNNYAEPIVDSADEAITCFLTSGINYLVIGDYLVAKNREEAPLQMLLTLAPTLSPSRQLTKQQSDVWRNDGTHVSFAIESLKSRYFGKQTFTISSEVFNILQRANGSLPCKTLFEQSEIPNQRTNQVTDEILRLWSQRAISLLPVAAGVHLPRHSDRDHGQE
jgi:carbamoyltransferase